MLVINQLKKTKKNEKKFFGQIVRVDRQAFGKLDDQVAILNMFWKSSETRILTAEWVKDGGDKKSSSSKPIVVGYAAYQLKLEKLSKVCQSVNNRFDHDLKVSSCNKGGAGSVKHCYLMRIAVDKTWQGKGIGRKQMEFLSNMCDVLELEVNSENEQAIGFYHRMKMLNIRERTSQSQVKFLEFVLFQEGCGVKVLKDEEEDDEEDQGFGFKSGISQASTIDSKVDGSSSSSTSQLKEQSLGEQQIEDLDVAEVAL